MNGTTTGNYVIFNLKDKHKHVAVCDKFFFYFIFCIESKVNKNIPEFESFENIKIEFLKKKALGMRILAMYTLLT